MKEVVNTLQKELGENERKLAEVISDLDKTTILYENHSSSLNVQITNLKNRIENFKIAINKIRGI